MSILSGEEDRPDDDPTDELPVLSESALLAVSEDLPELQDELDEPTGEHETGALASLALAARPEPERHSQASATLKIESLEGDIARLTARWSGVEEQLAARDAEIARLDGAIETARQAAEEALSRERAARAAAEQALERERAARAAAAEALERERAEAAAATELLAQETASREALADNLAREHSARAALAEDLVRASEARAALDTELEEERAARRSAQEELESARMALDQARAEAPPATPGRERDELAALTAYIENRREHWEQTEALAAARLTKIGELERELGQRLERQRAAEARARDETARADELRAELVELGRKLKAAERPLVAVKEVAHHVRAPTAAERNANLEHAMPDALELQAIAATREKERAEIAAELDAARAELVDRRASLEQARADLARLERTLLEKDRALDARNARVATLERELEHKIAALQRLSALDASVQRLDARMSGRLVSRESSSPPATNSPILVCLSGEKPQRYALDKSVMTIGRSSQCDIQVLTHFISREHARLFVSADGVVIEDLGSTNGVFVNSARVVRHLLRHSDLVTVGETQFRFLEAVSH